MRSTFLLLFFLSCNLLGLKAQKSYWGRDIPVDTSYTVYNTYNKFKAKFPEASPALPILPEGVVAERDVVYTVLTDSVHYGRKLHLDIFRPAKPGKYPALIMVHGGGWRSGNKSLQVPMAMQIAARGYVTVTVEYQLLLEAIYPNAVFNIKSAIRWMCANADKYGIDSTRIAISGCSAGGQLASLVGLTSGVSKFEGNMGNSGHSSAIRAVIDIDGVLDFMAPASLNLPHSPQSLDALWIGGTFEEKPALWKEVSPIFWVNKMSPPVLFLNSGFPKYHAGQDEMIGMMNEFGIYTEVHKFDVKMHPFWLLHPWMDQTVNYMSGFLDKVFKR